MLESTPFMLGDSAQDDLRKEAFTNFSQKLEMCATGAEFPFTLQLRDPLAGSFIGPRLGLSVENDPHLTVMDYERTFDEDEELGLHDIQVDDYGDALPEENPNLAETSKRWGPDHPHEYAKGCDDGIKIAQTADNHIDQPMQTNKNGDVEVSTAEGELNNFVAASSFCGSREGFVFKMGHLGLGYYRDIWTPPGAS